MSILSFLWVWSSLINSMVNSVNMLYMVLSHTGSLYWSTGASEHVKVQINFACKSMAGFINYFYQ